MKIYENLWSIKTICGLYEKNDEKFRQTFGGTENLHYLCPRKHKIRNNMSKEIPSREELLLRVEASKERKRKRLAEMEVRARELFKERTGNEPKYVYSL